MAVPRGLDEILSAEDNPADKLALAERWNAQVANRVSKEKAQPAVKTSGAGPKYLRNTLLVLAGIATALFAIFLIFTANQKSANQFASQGDQYRQQNNVEGAIAAYTEAIRLFASDDPGNPKLASIHCDRADLYLSRNQYKLAITDYTEALRLQPRNARARMGRSDAYNAGGNRELAIADYMAALRLDPDRDMTWVNRSGELLRNYDPARASRLIHDSIEVFGLLMYADPGNKRWPRDLSASYYKEGAALSSQKQFVEALEVFRRSLIIFRPLVLSDPANRQLQGDAGALSDGLGIVSYNLVLNRDFQRALDAANLAILLAPAKLWLYTNQAHALMFLGHIAAARAVYLRYRGERNVSGGDGWEAAVLKDFRELARLGLTRPLMKEIEARFSGGRG